MVEAKLKLMLDEMHLTYFPLPLPPSPILLLQYGGIDYSALTNFGLDYACNSDFYQK